MPSNREGLQRSLYSARGKPYPECFFDGAVYLIVFIIVIGLPYYAFGQK
jgi:hypothetical protein